MQIVTKVVLYAFILGAIFLLSTFLYFENSSTFAHVLTFLSVTTGFSITSLSIIATSRFSKNLYEQEDPIDNSKTLLHQLVGKFERAIITFTTTIMLILIFSFIEPIEVKQWSFWNTQISIKSLLSSCIWLLTFLSIWNFTKLLRLFAKFVIQSAKKQ